MPGITLEQLLEARDQRRRLQLATLGRICGKTLIVLTVNIPGSVKRTGYSVAAGLAGVAELCRRLGDSVAEVDIRDLNTGFEAFVVARQSNDEAKRLAMDIERDHPLGRLLDIDVIGSDGVPVSRGQFGEESRRCLICGDDARVCMRLRRHPVEELTAKIKGICNGYFRRF